jgi:hypothetical protein
MTNVLEQFPSAPEADLIHRVIARIFNASGMRGRVELSWTDPHPPHALKYAFNYDLADLDDLAEKAVSLNRTPNRNVYISAGLRRTDVQPNKRASDEDVFACVACWADFDGDGDFDRAYSKVCELGIKPNVVVVTGTHPHLRAQMWWVLDEPVEDLGRHKVVQELLAKILQGDPTVVNPSRVMRLGGSVAWPIKKGRRVEVTHLADVDMREANYLFEELESALLRSGAADTGAAQAPGAPMLDFNAADGPVDVQHALVEGLKPGKFHLNMRAAVASMLAQSTPPRVVFDTIAAMVRREGVNVDERLQDLNRLVHGAIEKGIYKPITPNAQPPVDAEELKRRFRFASHEAMLERDPPDWQLEKFVQTNSLSAIYAPSGSFKTFVALDMGLSIATGQPWHGHRVRQGRVLYVASEGSASFAFRVQAWANARYDGRLIPASHFMHLSEDVNLLSADELRAFVEAAQEQMEGLDFVIFDTLARAMAGADENATKDMVALVSNIDKLRGILGTSAMVIHHTGKDESKGGRGSNALRGALDHEFRLRREPADDKVKLITTKQKDADEAMPIWLKLGRIEVTHPKTGEVRTSLVPTLCEGMAAGVPDAIVRADAHVGLRGAHLKALQGVKDNPGISTHALAGLLAVRPDNLGRTLRVLADRGLVVQVDGFWRFVPNEPQGEKYDEDQADREI